MGCDIHVCVEVRYRTLGRWTGTGELLNPGRYYDAFGRLAGVRRDGPAPKGLPPDASQEVAEAYAWWEGDAHSASWATLEEWEAAAELTGPEWMAPVAYARAALEGGSYAEARIVYWFDN